MLSSVQNPFPLPADRARVARMDYMDYLKFFAALIFVLCLMGGLVYVLKRFGLGTNTMISPSKKRLKIVEILPIDAGRRVALIQRDDRQHLVLLSSSGETVIETNRKTPLHAAYSKGIDGKTKH